MVVDVVWSKVQLKQNLASDLYRQVEDLAKATLGDELFSLSPMVVRGGCMVYIKAKSIGELHEMYSYQLFLTYLRTIEGIEIDGDRELLPHIEVFANGRRYEKRVGVYLYWDNEG